MIQLSKRGGEMERKIKKSGNRWTASWRLEPVEIVMTALVAVLIIIGGVYVGH